MKTVDGKRLLSTTDAVVWAEEFAKVRPEIDQHFMVTWFANAIETGKSFGIHAGRKALADELQELAANIRTGWDNK